MRSVLKGNKVILEPMQKKEFNEYYNQVANADSVRWWYGELYGDKLPSKTKFKKDWYPYLYPGKDQTKIGRSFKIIHNKKWVGQVNFNKFNQNRTSTDIFLFGENKTSKGLGTDALKTLLKYLFKTYDLDYVVTGAHTKNKRAQKAYEKAGFKKVNQTKKIREDKYIQKEVGLKDSVVMIARKA